MYNICQSVMHYKKTKSVPNCDIIYIFVSIRCQWSYSSCKIIYPEWVKFEEKNSIYFVQHKTDKLQFKCILSVFVMFFFLFFFIRFAFHVYFVSIDRYREMCTAVYSTYIEIDTINPLKRFLNWIFFLCFLDIHKQQWLCLNKFVQIAWHCMQGRKWNKSFWSIQFDAFTKWLYTA